MTSLEFNGKLKRLLQQNNTKYNQLQTRVSFYVALIKYNKLSSRWKRNGRTKTDFQQCNVKRAVLCTEAIGAIRQQSTNIKLFSFIKQIRVCHILFLYSKSLSNNSNLTFSLSFVRELSLRRNFLKFT